MIIAAQVFLSGFSFKKILLKQRATCSNTRCFLHETFSCSAFPFDRPIGWLKRCVLRLGSTKEWGCYFLSPGTSSAEKKTLLGQPRLPKRNPTEFPKSIFRKQQASAQSLLHHSWRKQTAQTRSSRRNLLAGASFQIKQTRSPKMLALEHRTESVDRSIDFKLREQNSKKNTGFTEVVVCFVESAAV